MSTNSITIRKSFKNDCARNYFNKIHPISETNKNVVIKVLDVNCTINSPHGISNIGNSNKTISENGLRDVIINIDINKSIKTKFLNTSIKRFFDKMRLNFEEYCESSTLHGLRYLGKQQQTTGQRIFWLLIILVSIILCSQMIYLAWQKWNMSSVIISFSQNPTTIWEIPHPAVTICPDTKFNKTLFDYSEMRYFTMNHPEYTNDAKKVYDASLLCSLIPIYTGNKTTNEDILKFFHEINSFSLENIMLSCTWGSYGNCEKLFKLVLTEEGICFSINTLDYKELLMEDVQDEKYLNYGIKSEWTLHSGYSNISNKSAYPKRPIFTGPTEGLTINLVGFIEDIDYYCQGLIQGYKIYVHSPEEMPGLKNNYFRSVFNEQINMDLNFKLITTSEGLLNYSPNIRHCYFPGEKQLRFFKVYNEPNCKFECFVNFTLKTCGCVAFNMPRINGTPICASGSRDCVEVAEKELLAEEVEKKISQSNRFSELENNNKNCECLPACSSIFYDAAIFRANLDINRETMSGNDEIQPGQHLTRIILYFKDTEFTSYVRSELYGSTDFVANCGGFLGLFMGFSFLSILELIYFLTLRLWCKIKSKSNNGIN